MPHSYNDRSMVTGRVLSANDRKLLAVMRGHPRYAGLAEQLAGPGAPAKPKPKGKAAAAPEPRNVKPAGDEDKRKPAQAPERETKAANPHAVGAMTTKSEPSLIPGKPEPEAPAKSADPHAVGAMTTHDVSGAMREVPKPEPKRRAKDDDDEQGDD